MSKPSFRQKPESRIGLDAGSESGMTFDMFNCHSNNSVNYCRVWFSLVKYVSPVDFDKLSVVVLLTVYYIQGNIAKPCCG